MFSIFNNREIAIIIWSVFLFVWLLFKSQKFCINLLDLLVSILKLWKVFLLMILYIILSVYVLYEINFWNINLVKITIFWVFGSAIIFLMNYKKMIEEKGYLKNILKEIIGLTVVISFVSNFYSFSLPIELLLIPFIAILGMMSAFSLYKIEYQKTGIVLNKISIILGLIIFGFSSYKTIINFDIFFNMITLQDFLIPILLSIMFIPFVYIFYFYSKWEYKKKMRKYN